ncbi:MAG: putative DNA mismatch repair protein msh-2 [Streblomastix strix]|uniref:Putative DNA mismatch repair protein msh-2 n=1 Tax=Streblomastix strix TaxID=222440 RepID=A0A5J4WXC5_9EUKA|nr:MAG: putative DNA mismatch repair protein msh-2 [Streblomastix strix]
MIDESDRPVRLMAIAWEPLPRRTIGLCWIDRDRHIISLIQSQGHRDLEAALLQNFSGNRNVLMQGGNDYDTQKIKQILTRCDLIAQEVPKAQVKFKETFDELCKLVGGENCQAVAEWTVALHALQHILTKYNIKADNINYLYELQIIDTGSHMLLDASAMFALGVFESGVEGPKTTTLFGLLNKCRTTMGERRLREWLRQPSASLKEIQERHDIVEIFTRNTQLRSTIQDQNMRFMGDIEKIALRFSRNRGSLQDAVNLFLSVQRLPQLCKVMQELTHAIGPQIYNKDQWKEGIDFGEESEMNQQEDKQMDKDELKDADWAQQILDEHFIRPLTTIYSDFTNFIKLVDVVIDVERAEREHSYMIKPQFDKQLQDLAQQQQDVEQSINNIVNGVRRNLFNDSDSNRKGKGSRGGKGAKQQGERLKLEQNSILGYYMRLSRKDEKLIRNNSSSVGAKGSKSVNSGVSYILLETRKDGVRFTTVGLRAASDQHRILEDEYSKKQKTLEGKALDIIASYTGAMEELSQILSVLDVLTSFAQVAVSAPVPFVRPRMALGKEFASKQKLGQKYKQMDKDEDQDMSKDKEQQQQQQQDNIDYDESLNGMIVLRGVRHPCLEVQEGVNFIPNDSIQESGKWRGWEDEDNKQQLNTSFDIDDTDQFLLNNNTSSSSSSSSSSNSNIQQNLHRREKLIKGSKTRKAPSFVIVTGPNMGGKSTFIRSVGVSVLMAQAGSFVPCDAALISIRSRIMARVGAGDALWGGISTFMAEMLDTAAIVGSGERQSDQLSDSGGGATEDSLVIVDELGRGTSTYDGFGLAWAIAEHIAINIGCPTLFATHFHEVTALADEVGSVSNCHVSVLQGEDTLTFLFKIEPGPCERSFGIHVAEMAGFPAEVVAMARKKLAELEGGGDIEGKEMDIGEKGVMEKDKLEEAKDAIGRVVGRLAETDVANLDDESAIALALELAGLD